MNCEENVSQIVANLQQDENGSDVDVPVFTTENFIGDVTNSLKYHLQPLYDAEAELIKENRVLVSSLQKESYELLHQRKKCNTAVINRNTLFEKCKVLETQLERRSKQVEKLQKEGTVLLWKREADKLVEELKHRNLLLEARLKSIQEEKEVAHVRFQGRIEMLNDQLRRLKMERQRNVSPVGQDDQMQANLERRVFLLERALIITQSELKKQQLFSAGFLQGLTKDFKIMMEKSHIKEENYTFYQSSFLTTMEDILNAIIEGNVHTTRSKLASHYHGNGIKSKLSDVRKLPKVKHEKNKENHEMKPIEDAELSGLPIDPCVTDWRDGDGAKSVTDLKEMLVNGPVEIHNPIVFNETTGDVDFKLVQEKFPQLNMVEIEEMHRLFTIFDINNDDQLDTPELLKAVPESLGRMSTADEIVDAMKDTDLDHSGTIDFYEFLNILNIIKRNKGVPKLLQRDSFPALGNRKSSICTLQ